MHLTKHKACRVTVPQTASGLLLFVFKHVSLTNALELYFINIKQETACSLTSCFTVNMKGVVSTIPAVIAWSVCRSPPLFQFPRMKS